MYGHRLEHKNINISRLTLKQWNVDLFNVHQNNNTLWKIKIMKTLDTMFCAGNMFSCVNDDLTSVH